MGAIAVARPRGALTWTPDIEAGDADDAWHPADASFAPLRGVDGTLVGVSSVDLPVHFIVVTGQLGDPAAPSG